MKLINPIVFVDINKEVAEEFMKNPTLVQISGTDRCGWMTERRRYNDLTDDIFDKYDDIAFVQIRHHDDNWGLPISIEDNVVVNRYGDMIISGETYNIILGECEIDAIVNSLSSGLYYEVDAVSPVIEYLDYLE